MSKSNMSAKKKLELITSLKELGAIHIEVSPEGAVIVDFAPVFPDFEQDTDPTEENATNLEAALWSA